MPGVWTSAPHIVHPNSFAGGWYNHRLKRRPMPFKAYRWVEDRIVRLLLLAVERVEQVLVGKVVGVVEEGVAEAGRRHQAARAGAAFAAEVFRAAAFARAVWASSRQPSRAIGLALRPAAKRSAVHRKNGSACATR